MEVIILAVILVVPCIVLFIHLMNLQFKWAYLTGIENAFRWQDVAGRGKETMLGFWSFFFGSNDPNINVAVTWSFWMAFIILGVIAINLLRLLVDFCDRWLATQRTVRHMERKMSGKVSGDISCCARYCWPYSSEESKCIGGSSRMVRCLGDVSYLCLQTYLFVYSICLWFVVLMLLSTAFIVLEWSLVMSLLDPVSFLPLGVFAVTCIAIVVYSWYGLSEFTQKLSGQIRSVFQRAVNQALDAFIERSRRPQATTTFGATTFAVVAGGTANKSLVTEPANKYSDERRLDATAQNIFETLLPEGKETLEFSEFQLLFERLQLNLRPNLQQRMFAKCDVNDNNEIDKNEFARGWNWLLDELVEQVAKELGVNETSMVVTGIMVVIYFGLVFAFLVLFLGLYENNSEFSSIITSLGVVLSGYLAKLWRSVSSGELLEKKHISNTIERVFGEAGANHLEK